MHIERQIKQVHKVTEYWQLFHDTYLLTVLL